MAVKEELPMAVFLARDSEEVETYADAVNYRMALCDVCNALRREWKYGDKPKTVEKFYDDDLFDILSAHGLDRNKVGF